MFAKDVIATPALPIFIMLSGVSCAGKSTWREHMMQELNRLNIPITVLSADDMAPEFLWLDHGSSAYVS
ncbi:MAG: hypothetical protein P4L79_13195 [Legionella sp.]|uniref:hypothetical protein n=1 Tax=Legionella sp. TaxID=459 RepID=UPI0028411C17|nr:hypothetical protein [Legionella sp.]